MLDFIASILFQAFGIGVNDTFKGYYMKILIK